jgi:hypothetical protein
VVISGLVLVPALWYHHVSCAWKEIATKATSLPATGMGGKIAQQSWTIGAGALRSVVAEIRTHDPEAGPNGYLLYYIIQILQWLKKILTIYWDN